MKNIFYLLIAVLLLSCQSSQEENRPMPAPQAGHPAMEQNGPQGVRPPQAQEPQMSREERMEEIKLQKIAYMTDELKLSEEESQRFWPVYNKWWDENMTLMHDQYSAYKSINKKEGATMSDLETIASLYEKQAELVRKWGAEFSKVISEEKVAKVFVTEERFKNYLIRKGPKWGQPEK